MRKSFIWVTTEFEGIHCYPAAPDEVSFLRFPHRHIFHVKVWIEVFHNDRDIEFILFKRFIDSIITDHNFHYKSCEMISDDIHKIISTQYKNREIKIEVSEDKENGSFIDYGVDK
jgi:hypothetical protein